MSPPAATWNATQRTMAIDNAHSIVLNGISFAGGYRIVTIGALNEQLKGTIIMVPQDSGANQNPKTSVPTKGAEAKRAYIPGLYVDGIRPFNAPIELKFDEYVNILIGPNGIGKTTILRILAAGGEISTSSEEEPQIESYAIVENYEKNGNFLWRVTGGEDLMPIYLPAMRPNLPIVEIDDADSDGKSDLLENHLHWLDIGKIEGKLEELKKQFGNNEGVQTAIKVAQECTRYICREDFDGIADLTESYAESVADYEEHARSERSQSLTDNKQNRRNRESIRQSQEDQNRREAEFEGKKEQGRLRNWIMRRYRSGGRRAVARRDSYPTLQQMCSGAMTTFTWVLYVSLRLAMARNFATGWEKQSALLLIDEIENHLHPIWQRRVIDALRKYFPGCQVFAASHSPFLVVGRASGQVHLLERDEYGVIDTVSNRYNTTGWTTEEVLRVLMGVHHPTDEVTSQAAEEFETAQQTQNNFVEPDDDFPEGFFNALNQTLFDEEENAQGE